MIRHLLQITTPELRIRSEVDPDPTLPKIRILARREKPNADQVPDPKTGSKFDYERFTASMYVSLQIFNIKKYTYP